MLNRKVDAQRPLQIPGQPPLSEDEQQALAETIGAKLSAGGTHGSRAASSAVVHLGEQDAVKASVDFARMAGDSIRTRTGASKLGATGEAIAGVDKAAAGDLHGAAVHMAKAAETLGPRFADSRLGAAANAVVLTTSPERLRDAHTQVRDRMKQAVDPSAPSPKRAQAWLDLSSATWQLAYAYRVLSNAAVSIAKFSVGRLGRVARFAPAALKAQAGMARAAASPLGKAFAAFNKWVPLLNVAGVALSAKTAIDVYRDAHSSRAAIGLASASLVLAGAGLWAAVALGFWPFLGLTALGIGADVALVAARKRDRLASRSLTQIAAPAEAAGESPPSRTP